MNTVRGDIPGINTMTSSAHIHSHNMHPLPPLEHGFQTRQSPQTMQQQVSPRNALSHRKTAFKAYIRFSDREHEMLRRGVQRFGVSCLHHPRTDNDDVDTSEHR
jgi:hypothetical protein